jgi:hypothetical protein
VRTGEREQPYEYQKDEQFRIFVDKEQMTQHSDMFSDYVHLLEDIKV